MSYAAPQAVTRRRSNERWIVAAAASVAVLALVVEGAVALYGWGVANRRIQDTDHAISTAIAHQDALNDAFADIGANFQWLNSSNPPAQIRPLADQFVQTWHVDGETISTDDTQLAGMQRRLGDQPWLTFPSRDRLAQAKTRVTHARKALSQVGTIASDLEKDGQFLQKYADAANDLIGAAAAVKASNAEEYGADLSKLVADAGAALPLADGPGLPPEIHALMSALYNFAKDTRTAVLELAAGTTTKAEATKVLNSDLAALEAVSTARVPDEIDAYFKPYVDEYRAEASAASH